jgi:hypothetical protein
MAGAESAVRISSRSIWLMEIRPTQAGDDERIPGCSEPRIVLKEGGMRFGGSVGVPSTTVRWTPTPRDGRKSYMERAAARSPVANSVRERRNSTLAAAAETAMRRTTTGQVTAVVDGAGTAATAMTGNQAMETPPLRDARQSATALCYQRVTPIGAIAAEAHGPNSVFTDKQRCARCPY